VFGDNGMISVIICRPGAASDWQIDTWLMSCRVLGRRVEQAVLRQILSRAEARGIQRLVGVYRPTDRNKLVENHYSNLGFAQTGTEPDGTTHWELAVAGTHVAEAPMTVRVIGLD
jgi:FkbH-like protein